MLFKKLEREKMGGGEGEREKGREEGKKGGKEVQGICPTISYTGDISKRQTYLAHV